MAVVEEHTDPGKDDGAEERQRDGIDDDAGGHGGGGFIYEGWGRCGGENGEGLGLRRLGFRIRGIRVYVRVRVCGCGGVRELVICWNEREDVRVMKKTGEEVTSPALSSIIR